MFHLVPVLLGAMPDLSVFQYNIVDNIFSMTIATMGGTVAALTAKAGGAVDGSGIVNLQVGYAQLYRSEKSALKTRRRLERMEWSMSLFVMYFGTNRRFEQLAHHTILFGNRYRGLLNDIFKGHTLPDDFSLYLHAPICQSLASFPLLIAPFITNTFPCANTLALHRTSPRRIFSCTDCASSAIGLKCLYA